MASSTGSSKDSGNASSRHFHDSKIKQFGAMFIMQIRVTDALMAFLKTTKFVLLPEEARERMAIFLNDKNKGRCRNGEGLKCSAYDMQQNAFVLRIMLCEDGHYALTAPWEFIAGKCQLSPGSVVSFWGYEVENFGFPFFLFRLDGIAEEGEPWPSYEPADSDD